LSLVQGWTGFSPTKDIAGGHDAPCRESGTHRRRRRQAFRPRCPQQRRQPRLRMATGRVQIGWSLRAPKTETQTRTENRFGWKSITKTKPADTRNPNGYPKLEWIPETRG
jgi:hypothetical protein